MIRFLDFSSKIKNNVAAVYVGVFLTLLGVISFFSMFRLTMAYKEDKKINNQVTGEDKLESDFIAEAFGKDFFLNLNGGMHLLLGQAKMNNVIRLNNGYLAGVNDSADSEIFAKNAEYLGDFEQKLKERGIPFLYIVAPYKIQADDPELPHNFEDHVNEDIDSFKNELQAVGIEPLDLRETISSQEDPYSLFYRTDHHWNDRGGFLGYTAIANQISKMLGVTVDQELLSMDSYTEEVYPAIHLGSHGKSTGSVFAGGADDFDILVPTFDTLITDVDNEKQGPLDQIIFDKSFLQAKNPLSLDIYSSVLCMRHFRSETTGCGKKVMLICDSMGRMVFPYLTLAFGDVYYVDAYHPDTLSGALLDSYHPDIVVMMHYPTLIYYSERFQYPNI